MENKKLLSSCSSIAESNTGRRGSSGPCIGLQYYRKGMKMRNQADEESGIGK